MYTTNEVAEGFGVTRQTIQNWVEAGKLAYSSKRNLRGDRLFDPVKIEELRTEDLRLLVSDKLLRAFKMIGKPVFVEHTGLFIRSLNGFPGGLTQTFWDKLQAAGFSELIGRLDAALNGDGHLL